MAATFILFFALISSILQLGAMIGTVVNAIGQSRVIGVGYQVVWTLITSCLWSIFYMLY